jgi:hypothetical protein
LKEERIVGSAWFPLGVGWGVEAERVMVECRTERDDQGPTSVTQPHSFALLNYLKADSVIDVASSNSWSFTERVRGCGDDECLRRRSLEGDVVGEDAENGREQLRRHRDTVNDSEGGSARIDLLNLATIPHSSLLTA